MESRLRSTAAKLVKLSSPVTPSRATTDIRPMDSRPRVTREQAEAQLKVADDKFAKVELELYKQGYEEAAMRTKLLTHTAGILGLSLRRKEELEAGLDSIDLPATLSKSTRSPLQSSTNLVSTSPPASPEVVTTNQVFEGHHFYSGNRDAIAIEHQRSLSSSSQLSLSQLATSSANAIAIRLQTQVDQLAIELEAARSVADSNTKLQSELDEIRSQLLAGQLALSEARSENILHQKSATTARESDRQAIVRLESDLEQIRNESTNDSDSIKEELDHSRRELEEVRQDLEAQTATSAQMTASLSKIELDRDDVRQQLETLQRTQEQLEGKFQHGEDLSVSLREEKDELQRVIDQHSSQYEAHRLSMSAAEQKRKLAQAVGDVLRRHRTRPVLGVALREMKPFEDDNLDRTDLSAYVGTTLEAYFERLSDHMARVTDDLEEWKTTAEAHRNDKDELEIVHRDLGLAHHSLQTLHSELEARYSSDASEYQSNTTAIRHDADLAKEETNRLQGNIVTLQSKCDTLEGEMTDVTEASASNLSIKLAELDSLKDQVGIFHFVGLESNSQFPRSQISKMENRLKTSSIQEVAMLERLNE